ncbi:unnamed protein product [Dicrocoelium dendriticum]|nr:unnamed protein product [Dicrocoelium dendriticum]
MVGVIYKAPWGHGTSVLDFINSHGNRRDCLIVGDFNAPHINWDLLHCHLSPESFDTSLLETVLKTNLTQHITSPTRLLPGQTPHILDLVLTPSLADVSELTLLPPIGKSDHCTISFLWTKRLAIRTRSAHRRNFWRTDAFKLRVAAGTLDWNVPQHLDLDAAWNDLSRKLKLLIEEAVPFKKNRPLSKGPPWIDRELRANMKQRRKLWDRFKLSRSDSDYSKYKAIRNFCSLQKREKRQRYEHSLAEQSLSRPKILFSYLNRSSKTGCGIPALSTNEPDMIHYDDDAKADLLALQFSSVYTKGDRLANPHIVAHTVPLEHIDIDAGAILKLLLELNSSSSPGPDGLHPHFLKMVAEFIAVPLCQIFQLSLKAGRLPVDWKTGVVMPKYKGGSRQDPANYRPICLTSVACKIMEKLIKSALHRHCEDLNFTSVTQHGFRKGHSCITNLLVAREKWAKLVDAGKRLDVVFIDFSKAFDRVPHQELLSKLGGIGVTGNLLLWISDFLQGRNMQVKVNDTLSFPVPMYSGVPQGSVLGPELFKIYINDLPSILQTDCLIYADDLKLWSEVSSLEDADRLQETLDLLHSWSIKWGLPVNKDKCSVLSIGAAEPLGIYHIGGHLLKIATQEKDLGTIISSDLKTTLDTLKKTAAANRMWGAIRRSFSKMTPQIFRLLFTSHIRPILEFGHPAIAPLSKHESDKIEKIQRRASKFVLGLRNLPYPTRLQRMNLFPLDYRRRRGDLIYTRRILRGELGNELRQFFQLRLGSSTRGHSWKLFKPRRLKVRSDVALSTRVTNDWNRLPDPIVNAQSEASFKRLLDIFLLSTPGSCRAGITS